MTPAIALSEVEAAYDGRLVLRSVTLEIAAGERVGLVGANGAGKTTLLHVLLGFHTVRRGAVRVAGLDVVQRGNRAAVRRQAGIVFQNADDQLFSGSVHDDVAFGPLNLDLDDAEVRTRVAQALAQVGATDLAERTSHHLSAGEKRRVAIAAVLAMQPEVLILDEPTGELDPRGRRAMLELLGALSPTLLVATHDLEFVRSLCTRVVVLEAGTIAADGAADEVLGDEALMLRCGLEVPYSLRVPRHVRARET